MDKDVIINWLRDGNEFSAAELLSKCELEYHYIDTGFSLGGGSGTDIYEAQIGCNRQVYSQLQKKYAKLVSQIEQAINECSQQSDFWLQSICWRADPNAGSNYLPKTLDAKVSDALIRDIERLKKLMIAYVTDGRKDDQPDQYYKVYIEVDLLLEEQGLVNPNPHHSLESFWEFCKMEVMDTWASRRAYVSDLYADLMAHVVKSGRRAEKPRNWDRVNNSLADDLAPVRLQWAKAKNYIYSSTPDYENGVKEAINSIESAVRLASEKENETLGRAIKGLGLDQDIERLISQCYGYASNRASVRHGGTKDSNLTKEEAEFFLEFAAISISYVKSKTGMD